MKIEGNAIKTIRRSFFSHFPPRLYQTKNEVAKTHIEPLIGVTMFVDTLTLKFKGMKGEVNSGILKASTAQLMNNSQTAFSDLWV